MLSENTTGSDNTAVGGGALAQNNGSDNTAVGGSTLSSNTSGGGSTAVGFAALQRSIGSDNTAVGFLALSTNVEGESNTAIGTFAFSSGGGSENTAVGAGALPNVLGNFNTAIGWTAGDALTSGSGNIYIGSQTHGTAVENDTCYIANIFSQTSASGIPVLVSGNSKLGTTTSSKRFKEEIKPMDKTSEALFALKPVTFRYKKGIDPQGIPQFGLVAEDVEKVNPDLVVRDKEGKPYSVRYDQVNAMLLNEFLKARHQIDAQQKQIDALTAGLQKVSARIEASKPAPQVVNNP